MPRVESDPTSIVARSSVHRVALVLRGHGSGWCHGWRASMVVSPWHMGTGVGSMASGLMLGCSREMTGWAEPGLD
jgi:hypothetical protein